MATARVSINPNMLIWAIERGGKNVEQFLGENPQVHEWIEGTKLPTLRNLTDFAKKLYVPLGYLYLQEPPIEQCPIPFFRSSTNSNNNINVMDTVVSLQERQEWLSEYLYSEGYEELDFVGILQANDHNIDFACEKIYEILNIPINWAFDHRTVDETIKHISTLIEDRGIIMCFNSVVGFNNKREIPVNLCRGFALIDKYCPFIFINNKDAKSAQVFTIFHELIHILIGYSAGIGDEELYTHSELEVFCDKVAAICLVPRSLLIEEWSKLGGNFDLLSKKFKVSRYVLARRAKEEGLITDDYYFYLYNLWRNEPLRNMIKSNGGSFIPMALKKTSRTFLAHVNNAISSNKILHLDAYRLTGLKGDTFRKLINSREFYN